MFSMLVCVIFTNIHVLFKVILAAFFRFFEKKKDIEHIPKHTVLTGSCIWSLFQIICHFLFCFAA
jgi:hypothetical protein